MATVNLNRALARIDSRLPALLASVRVALGTDTWVVGGFVRDALLGRQPYDLDLAVPSGAKGAAELIAATFGGSPFALDLERDTFRVALPEGLVLRTIDVAGLRGPDIEADLRLRDFTLNAIATCLTEQGLGGLIDPLGGSADIKRKAVRMVSEAVLRDDPLRILRAIRIAVELRFEVEAGTKAAISSLAPALASVAAERLRDEMMRILESSRAAVGVRMLDELTLLEVLLPELTRARGISQPDQYHYYDVFDHSLEALAVTDWLLSPVQPEGAAPRAMRESFWQTLGPHGLGDYFAKVGGGASRRALTKLATLLHDVSKPETKTTDAAGRVRFLGHSERGAKVGSAICRRLRLGNQETRFVALLIEEHLRPAQLSNTGMPTDRAIFKFFRQLDDAAKACLVLSLADAAAAQGPRLDLSRWRGHLAYINYVLERAAMQHQVLGGRHFVSGDTLIRALKIEPGPDVGRLLAEIDEAAGSGKVQTEEDAIRYARGLRQRWVDEERAPGEGVA